MGDEAGESDAGSVTSSMADSDIERDATSSGGDSEPSDAPAPENSCLGMWQGTFDEGERVYLEILSTAGEHCGAARYVFRVREMECRADFVECRFESDHAFLREGDPTARCNDGSSGLRCACHPFLLRLMCDDDFALATISVPRSGFVETFELSR